MKEILTANGRNFTCEQVTTGLDSITFAMENQEITEIEAFFRAVNSLIVTFEGEAQPHGIYEHLKFESAAVHEDGKVSVTMHIKNDVERRLDALEAGQEVQDGAIMEIAGIVG